MRPARVVTRVLASLLPCLLAAGCSGGGGSGNPTGPGSGAVASVRVEPLQDTVEVGQAITLEATLLDSRGRELEGRAAPFWSSSNPAVAAVDPGAPGGQGNPITVNGIAPGQARITATAEGRAGDAEIFVEAPANQTLLTGRVFDGETGQGIPNATVSFTFTDPLNARVATTGADGVFTSPPLPDVPAGEILNVTAQAAGYVSATVLGVSLPAPGATLTVEPIPLVRQSASRGGISGTVRNARTNEGVPGATVALLPGLGPQVTQQNPIRVVTSDAGGGFAFNQLDAGTYTLRANHPPDFVDGFRTGIAVGNNDVTPDQDVVLSPLGTSEIRIVLQWGRTPTDLDAHLTGPDPAGGRFHVFFPAGSRGALAAPPFAALDVDDVSSFGPETITITQLSSGTYRYSVHDFTNRNSATSTALANSGAQVEVYIAGGFVRRFLVPPGRAGTLWTVFELSGASIEGATITERNQMGFAEDPGAILGRSPGAPAGRSASASSDAAVIGRSIRALTKPPAR
jgi:hypothetical protein